MERSAVIAVGKREGGEGGGAEGGGQHETAWASKMVETGRTANIYICK